MCCLRRLLDKVMRQISESLDIAATVGADTIGGKAEDIEALNRVIQESREEYIKLFLSTDIASKSLFMKQQIAVADLTLPLANDNDNSSLSTTTAQDTDDIENIYCSICLDKYKPGDHVSFAKNENTPCHHHIYHENCINIWLLKNDNCPYCRRSYFSETFLK